MFDKCSHPNSKPRPANTGDFGWPCPHGGALQLQATTAAQHSVNCVVFYYPFDPEYSVDNILSRFKRKWEAVLQTPRLRRLTDVTSPDIIDLNSIAAEFATAAFSYRKYQGPYNFKAVVVVPVYGLGPDRPSGHAAITASAGLSAVGGRFEIDSVDVPMKGEHENFDLNQVYQGRALVLFIVAALPSE